MKSSTLILIAATPVFAMLAIPVGMAAQNSQDHHATHHHYKLVDTGTFGGPNGYVYLPLDFPPVLNEQGTVAGFADTPMSDPFPPFYFWDGYVLHAFQAGSEGGLTDLGALPGGGSSAALWIDRSGLIAGVSENGETDPQYPGLPQVRAVLWQEGKITDLGTLEGGYQSEANAVNSSGQVVGTALNTVPDSNSMYNFWPWEGEGGIQPPYLYQNRAFLWDKEHGMQDLGTLGGTDAQALLVNDQGQIVGESYINSTPSPYCAQNLYLPLTTGAFIWDKENGMRDLGSFGGTCTFATYLNNQGQVVGVSSLAGDQFQHAFLWEHGSLHDLRNTFGGDNATAAEIDEAGDVVGYASPPGNQTYKATVWKNGSMIDLGTLKGDQCSYGDSLNAIGQVVGQSATSCFAPNHVFLWENGSIVDLNSLIPPNSPIYLTSPETINDRGEIVSLGVDSGGNSHAFLLIPCDENHPGIDDCDYSLVDTTGTTEPGLTDSERSSSLTAETSKRLSGLPDRLRHRMGWRPSQSPRPKPDAIAR